MIPDDFIPGGVVIAACIFIMSIYYTVKSEYILAALFLLVTNTIAALIDYMGYLYENIGYQETVVYLTFTGFITAACAHIANSKEFTSFYAYTVLCCIYFVLALEDMILDYGLVDSIYYPVMYGGTLFLVYTVIYDRMVPIQRQVAVYVRRFSRVCARYRRSSQ